MEHDEAYYVNYEAESLMREHARIAHANLRHALADHRTWMQVPGASLVRRRNTR